MITAPAPAAAPVPAGRRGALIDGPAPGADRGVPQMVLRWVALLLGAVLVARIGSPATSLVWGVPLLLFTCLRTAEVFVGHAAGRFGGRLGLLVEVGLAAAVVNRTGGWHSGWVVTMVCLAALCGYSLPARWSGHVASAAVIVLFLVALAQPELVTRHSLDLDGLLVIVALSVSYAIWLVRYGDRDRTELAQTNERLMATNDLLVMLERILMRGEDATDPQQAARGVARLARELVQPDVVVVAIRPSAADLWRVLLADGVTLGAMIDTLAPLDRVVAGAAAGPARPVRLAAGAEMLSASSRSGVGLPLLVRGQLIGAVILESDQPDRWSDRELEVMAEMGRWAALIVDNACRFNALWVVGSAEERARVARNLHDNLGQSMAALGLELDLLARTLDRPEQAGRVRELRQGVTNMVAELRYNMRDLCCDVSDTRSLGEALGQLVRGVESRSRTRISLEVNAADRLPLAQEHQVLQMARVLLGAAVDARAGAVELAWTVDGTGGCLEVGYDSGASAPGTLYEPDAPILTAVAEVRDRCWAVGASVECEMRGPGSSRVRCRVAA